MGEMGVQVGNPAARQKALHQVAGLEEVLEGCHCGGCAEIGRRRFEVPRHNAGECAGQLGIMVEQRRQRAQKGLGQVIHPGADPATLWCTKILARLTHGKEAQREPEFFQQTNFIRNEGLGNAGKPLEDHPEHGGRRPGHGRLSRKAWTRWRMTSMPVSLKRRMASR